MDPQPVLSVGLLLFVVPGQSPPGSAQTRAMIPELPEAAQVTGLIAFAITGSLLVSSAHCPVRVFKSRSKQYMRS